MKREYFGRGMYTEILPSGTKVWRWRYRFNRKENRLSLGLVEYITPQQASARCDAFRVLLAQGINPSVHRKENQNFVILHGARNER